MAIDQKARNMIAYDRQAHERYHNRIISLEQREQDLRDRLAYLEEVVNGMVRKPVVGSVQSGDVKFTSEGICTVPSHTREGWTTYMIQNRNPGDSEWYDYVAVPRRFNLARAQRFYQDQVAYDPIHLPSNLRLVERTHSERVV